MLGRAKIRPATQADLSFAYRVLETTMRGHVEAIWGKWDEAAAREAVLEDVRMARSRIIEVDGEPAGLMRLDELPTHLQIEQLFLLPEHQRGGLGTSIVESAQVQARAMNLPLRLRVLRVNPARALYERLGFKIVQQTPERFFMEYIP